MSGKIVAALHDSLTLEEAVESHIKIQELPVIALTMERADFDPRWVGSNCN